MFLICSLGTGFVFDRTSVFHMGVTSFTRCGSWGQKWEFYQIRMTKMLKGFLWIIFCINYDSYYELPKISLLAESINQRTQILINPATDNASKNPCLCSPWGRKPGAYLSEMGPRSCGWLAVCEFWAGSKVTSHMVSFDSHNPANKKQVGFLRSTLRRKGKSQKSKLIRSLFRSSVSRVHPGVW